MTERRPNIFMRFEMYLIYTTVPGQWRLARISSSRSEDEIYFEMTQILRAIIEELDNQFETIDVEVRNEGRRIYIRSVA